MRTPLEERKMSRSGVRVCPDRDAVCRAAALLFVELAEEAILARGVFRVALSGGSTPRRMHNLLAEDPLRGRVHWNEVEFFWGDERSVPPDHPDSNFRMARETLLDKLDIAPERIHRMPADRSDLDTAAREYQAEMARVFGVDADDEPPRFDLLVQGMGEDGHTASLFPGTQALDESVRWVVGNEVPALSTRRMTFTYPLINHAAQVLFLVTGDDKAEPLAEVLEGERAPGRLPSQAVAPIEGELLWLIDEQAAGWLQERDAAE